MEAGTIFISHVEEDADEALRIADGLEEGGYPTWCYERDALPGPSYLLQTARQVEESAAVVLLISANSLGSNQVTAEVVRAHESGKPFVPVLIGLSHVEFAARQPEWREALGSATSIALPPGGAAVIVPRIRQGLAGLGIAPADGLPPREARPAVELVSSRRRPSRLDRRLVIPLAGVLVMVVLGVGFVVAGGGGGGDGRERDEAALDATSTRASGSAASTTVVTTLAPGSTAPPAPASTAPAAAASAVTVARAPQPTAPPATSPPVTAAPSATVPSDGGGGSGGRDEPPPGNGTFTTAAGKYEVLDASLTDEWCPPDGGACLTAGAGESYVVVALAPADGGSVNASPAFMGEANQSSVTFGGGQAGVKDVFVDQDVDIVEVVYGMVPTSAAGDSFSLHWPGNGPVALTIS